MKQNLFQLCSKLKKSFETSTTARKWQLAVFWRKEKKNRLPLGTCLIHFRYFGSSHLIINTHIPTLFSTFFLWYWREEFDYHSRVSLIGGQLRYSHDLAVCFSRDVTSNSPVYYTRICMTISWEGNRWIRGVTGLNRLQPRKNSSLRQANTKEVRKEPKEWEFAEDTDSYKRLYETNIEKNWGKISQHGQTVK